MGLPKEQQSTTFSPDSIVSDTFLPAELIDHIFSLVSSHRDRISLLLTCRLFYIYGRRSAYRLLNFDQTIKTTSIWKWFEGPGFQAYRDYIRSLHCSLWIPEKVVRWRPKDIRIATTKYETRCSMVTVILNEFMKSGVALKTLSFDLCGFYPIWVDNENYRPTLLNITYPIFQALARMLDRCSSPSLDDVEEKDQQENQPKDELETIATTNQWPLNHFEITIDDNTFDRRGKTLSGELPETVSKPFFISLNRFLHTFDDSLASLKLHFGFKTEGLTREQLGDFNEGLQIMLPPNVRDFTSKGVDCIVGSGWSPPCPTPLVWGYAQKQLKTLTILEAIFDSDLLQPILNFHTEHLETLIIQTEPNKHDSSPETNPIALTPFQRLKHVFLDLDDYTKTKSEIPYIGNLPFHFSTAAQSLEVFGISVSDDRFFREILKPFKEGKWTYPKLKRLEYYVSKGRKAQKKMKEEEKMEIVRGICDDRADSEIIKPWPRWKVDAIYSFAILFGAGERKEWDLMMIE